MPNQNFTSTKLSIVEKIDKLLTDDQDFEMDLNFDIEDDVSEDTKYNTGISENDDNCKEAEEEKIMEQFIIDGYDFSSLNEKERGFAKAAYISYESMADFCDAYEQMKNIANATLNQIIPLKDGWLFENSGFYKGYIIRYEPVVKNHKRFYVMDFLISGSNIRHIKFTQSFDDPINQAVRDAFGGNSLLVPIDLDQLYWCPMIIKVKNVVTRAGNNFSIIEWAHILSKPKEQVIHKMIDLIIEQNDSDGETE